MQKKVMALCLRVQFFLANPVVDIITYQLSFSSNVLWGTRINSLA